MRTTIEIEGPAYYHTILTALAGLVLDREEGVYNIGDPLANALCYVLEATYDRIDEDGGLGAAPENVRALIRDLNKLQGLLIEELARVERRDPPARALPPGRQS